MTLPQKDAELLAAVSAVDVMDVAGLIIANPRRSRVSLVDELALALAVEQLQAIAIEADILVRAIALPEDGDDRAMALKDHAIQTQLDTVRALIAAARGETNTDKQETYNAGSHS